MVKMDSSDDEVWKYTSVNKGYQRSKRGSKIKNVQTHNIAHTSCVTDNNLIKTIDQNKLKRKSAEKKTKTKFSPEKAALKVVIKNPKYKSINLSNQSDNPEENVISPKKPDTANSKVHVESPKQDPDVQTMKTPTKSSLEGNCPFCQMPFCCLKIESPRWHTMECMDMPLVAVEECALGLQCTSTIPSHYRRYKHTLLANLRSGVESEESSTDKGPSTSSDSCHKLDFADDTLGNRLKNTPNATFQDQIKAEEPSFRNEESTPECLRGNQEPSSIYKVELMSPKEFIMEEDSHGSSQHKSDEDIFSQKASVLDVYGNKTTVEDKTDDTFSDKLVYDASKLSVIKAEDLSEPEVDDVILGELDLSNLSSQDSQSEGEPSNSSSFQKNQWKVQLSDKNTNPFKPQKSKPSTYVSAQQQKTKCKTSGKVQAGDKSSSQLSLHCFFQSNTEIQQMKKYAKNEELNANPKDIIEPEQNTHEKACQENIMGEVTRLPSTLHRIVSAAADFFNPKPSSTNSDTESSVSRPPSSCSVGSLETKGGDAQLEKPCVSKGSAWGSRATRQCPFYKKIPETPFTVDAFSYGVVPGCLGYFLSHFHYDHYGGLTKTFSEKLYCNRVTGNLVEKKIRVSPQHIIRLDMERPCIIEGIEVTLLDANHCPGSVLMLFKLKNGRVILHTGDFRASPAMESYPQLTGVHIWQLYLDTTYCDPSYAFPPQSEVIRYAVKLATDFMERNPNGLIVVGSYTIGKERIFLAIAEELDCKVCVARDKKNILDCLEDPSVDKRLTLNIQEALIQVVPMNQLRYENLYEIMKKSRPGCDSVLALEPTGWTHSRQKGTDLYSLKPKLSRGNITLYGIPYSEHSSFLELKRFVNFIRPDKILPTVNNGNPKARKKMEGIFRDWERERQEGCSPPKKMRQTGIGNWLVK